MRIPRKVPGRRWRPPRVVEIREGSPCLGYLERGDELLAINGVRPRDIIDCLAAAELEDPEFLLRRGDRETRLRVAKAAGMPLGLVFDEAVFDGVMTCVNRCIFCFVDRMPPGLRPSLYLKDDDYRLSFYYGNFITLNNLAPREVRRILELRLSPLYVSLHATDPGLRWRMMRGNAKRGLEVLQVLLEAGIEVHLQVVCCPGVNDGPQLERTLEDVLHRYPAASLGVVPVGLTRYRPRHAPQLSLHDASSAERVLETVERFQELGMEMHGKRLFHAADEFYLLAGRDFPPAGDYEGFPQLENGVGMVRKFLEEASRCARVAAAGPPCGVVTGAAGKAVIERALRGKGLSGVEVVEAANGLFGREVTVTALLGGGDVVEALRSQAPLSRRLLIPDTLLREGRFLDDMTLEEAEERSGYSLLPVEVRGDSFLEALLGGGS